MGYTNYWHTKKLTREQIPENFWKDVEAVLDEIIKSDVKIASGDGKRLYKSGKEVLSTTGLDNWEANNPYIMLNGYENVDGVDETYETFMLAFDGDFGFCKTARLPYDIAVKCILMIAQDYDLLRLDDYGDSYWSFDGDTDEEEYTNASELYTVVKLRNRLDKKN